MEPSAVYADPELKRLYWHSRRGMLELDLLLVPFASTQLAALTPAQVQGYRALLAEEDQDLFLWLTRRAPAPTPALRDSVALVLAQGVSHK
ncbi:MAG: succinate dehydrogenase assembly factor 2 [Pseudomonadales bacterium]|jgi:antitoxin CptB|nr:succinate dehydrogenase assembly factor 2 [Pseudomonadales bacterium]